jgi:hypothetical protein
MNGSSRFPDPPQPSQPDPNPQVNPPMIYVQSSPSWKYKQIMRDLTTEKALTEDELNKLGAEGWELAGTLMQNTVAYFYFKQLIE